MSTGQEVKLVRAIGLPGAVFAGLGLIVAVLTILSLCCQGFTSGFTSGSVTLVVAASNASAKSKAQADYVCDGDDDQVEIQAAINALPANGGTVLLSEGTFIKGNVAGISIPSNVEIRLSQGTIITFKAAVGDGAVIFTNSTPDVGNSNIAVIGGILDGNKANQTGSQVAIRFTRVSASRVDTLIRNFRGKNIEEISPGVGNKFINRGYPNVEPLDFDPEDVYKKHRNWRLLTDFETDEFTAAVGTVVYDTTDKKYGIRSMKLITTVGGGVRAETTLSKFLFDPTKKAFRMWIKVDKPEDVGAPEYNRLIFRAPNWDNFYYFPLPLAQLPANTWAQINIPWWLAHGAPTPSPITLFGIAIAAKPGKVVTAWVDHLEVLDSLAPGGLITFTFDDSESTQYTAAYPILQEYGYAGVIFTLVSALGGSGKLTEAQLREMQRAGWDIADHSWAHLGQPRYSEAEIEADILRSANWLKEHGFSAYRFHAPPGGGWVYIDLMKKYFIFSRQGGAGFMKFPPLEYRMLTMWPYSATPVATVKTWVDRAKARGEWLILGFHGFDGQGWEPWSSANLRELVAYIHEQKVPVVTLSEAWKLITDPTIVAYPESSIRNSGTATIAAGATSVTVSHGLAATPTRVILTPTTDTAGKRYWVSAKGATTFTISIDSSHTADIKFDWKAQVGEG